MLAGRYFPPGAARFVPANASLAEKRVLRVEDHGGALLTEAPVGKVRISSRIGNVPRRLRFPDHSLFEADDNDAVDGMLAHVWHGTSRLHRLEQSVKWIAASLALALIAGVLFVMYGIPSTANWLAKETPPSIARLMSEQTMHSMDRIFLKATRLTAQQRSRVSAVFTRLAQHSARGAGAYRLEFRAAPSLGPNAFALPDGTVVVTDELVQLAQSDEELEGVFAHEMSHADNRHGLQEVYQAALIPAALALISGDVTTITQLGAYLPAVLVQSSYSRDFEQQADDDAAKHVIALGHDPAALAHLLQRIRDKECGKEKDACEVSWLGSHPLTDTRVARLLRQSKASGHKGK